MRQIREAKSMEDAVQERAQRMGSHAPPYKFLELIGKGSFGRVFKRYVCTFVVHGLPCASPIDRSPKMRIASYNL